MIQSTLIFGPHSLYKKVKGVGVKDEFGRIIPNEYPQWQFVCNCRCDDNTTTKYTKDNGEVFVPKYQVVAPLTSHIKEGDYIRCMVGDEVRGEGEVDSVRRGNFFQKMVLWI